MPDFPELNSNESADDKKPAASAPLDLPMIPATGEKAPPSNPMPGGGSAPPAEARPMPEPKSETAPAIPMPEPKNDAAAPAPMPEPPKPADSLELPSIPKPPVDAPK
jgi:hypothetical protein